jgi:hypothetical protein
MVFRKKKLLGFWRNRARPFLKNPTYVGLSLALFHGALYLLGLWWFSESNTFGVYFTIAAFLFPSTVLLSRFIDVVFEEQRMDTTFTLLTSLVWSATWILIVPLVGGLLGLTAAGKLLEIAFDSLDNWFE